MGKFRCLSSINLYSPLETVTSVLLSAASWPSPDKLGSAEIKTETSYIISEDIFGVTLLWRNRILNKGKYGNCCLPTHTLLETRHSGEEELHIHNSSICLCISLYSEGANLHRLYLKRIVWHSDLSITLYCCRKKKNKRKLMHRLFLTATDFFLIIFWNLNVAIKRRPDHWTLPTRDGHKTGLSFLKLFCTQQGTG